MEPDLRPTLLDELADDPFDDDLAKELKAREPRRWVNRGTLVLGGLVLLVGGFLGGALTQKHYGTTPAASTPGGTGFGNGQFGNGQFGNGAGGNGAGRRGQASASAGASAAPSGGAAGATGTITGKVKLIDGTTIYVETADGET